MKFARILVSERGKISETDILNVKNAGYTDQEITEIIAHVVLNIFTNYFNNATGVVVDFPEVELVAQPSI